MSPKKSASAIKKSTTTAKRTAANKHRAVSIRSGKFSTASRAAEHAKALEKLAAAFEDIRAADYELKLVRASFLKAAEFHLGSAQDIGTFRSAKMTPVDVWEFDASTDTPRKPADRSFELPNNACVAQLDRLVDTAVVAKYQRMAQNIRHKCEDFNRDIQVAIGMEK